LGVIANLCLAGIVLMGDCYQIIVDRDASILESERLATAIRAWLITECIIDAIESDCVLSGLGHAPGPRLDKAVDENDIDRYAVRRLRTNGLKIVSERTVFAYSLESVSCAHCRDEIEFRGPVSDAVDAWYSTGRTATIECPRCTAEQPVTELEYYPAMALGNLGFEFWNWPPLKASFLESLSRRLLGHRTAFLRGKF
jgi:hypothetical protein